MSTNAVDGGKSDVVEQRILRMQTDMATLQKEVAMVKESVPPRKRSAEEDAFEQACQTASEDPSSAADTLASLAKDAGSPALIEFARLCISGPVGHVGARRALRAVAIILLDKVLSVEPDNTSAMCVKGEALLPPIHVGNADPDAPMPVLKEAYALFKRAADLGSMEALFLKGRWLITMAPVHRSESQAAEGKRNVKTAAEAGLARALVFLAQCYEFPARFSPVSFTRDLPTGKTAREKLILSYYMKAAQLGDADALNDVGSSYATGYGGLRHDFDEAVRYYVKAIQAGSLHAFDNLGTHYETGMSGRFPERIDLKKALHYYRHGARMRCSKCAHNLAAAYEEGLQDTLVRDTTHAEKYYRHTIYLADDDNDPQTACRALKDLIALYITRIKMNANDEAVVERTKKRLARYLTARMIASTMNDVNKALAGAVKGKTKVLVDLVGEFNARMVTQRAKELLDRVHRDEACSESDKQLVKSMFGAYVPQEPRGTGRSRAKRRRTINE